MASNKNSSLCLNQDRHERFLVGFSLDDWMSSVFNSVNDTFSYSYSFNFSSKLALNYSFIFLSRRSLQLIRESGLTFSVFANFLEILIAIKTG